jgi:hypothetical protein
MGSWALAGTISDTRQAKRLFPLYGAGLIAGTIVGGLSTGPAADAIHAENLLFVWAGALIAVHVLARTVVRGGHRAQDHPGADAGPSATYATGWASSPGRCFGGCR